MNNPTNTFARHFTVSYQPTTQTRLAPRLDILENRLLHKAFVISHVPATWGWWQIALGLLLLSLLVGLMWGMFGFASLTAAEIYLFFALGDWIVLGWLPYSKRSFGPIGPQLFVMALPRIGVAILAAIIAWVWGSMGLGMGLYIGLQLFGSVVYLWGTLYEPFALGITQQTVQSPAFPVDLPPIRLLHLSDLHVERLTRREARLLTLVEQTQADIIVITGDYLNLSYVNDPIARAEVRKVLSKLKATYGVYAVLGSPPADPSNTTPSLFEGIDIRLLRDEVAVINFAEGRTLSLLGMDCKHNLEVDLPIFQNLVSLAPPDSMRVLLYHSPEMMPQVQEYPLDLYLCGHTHGGQVRLPFYGALVTSSSTGKQYEMGRYDEQDTTLYISRGIGLEGLSAPRLRLLCPPEIILFNLTG